MLRRSLTRLRRPTSTRRVERGAQLQRDRMPQRAVAFAWSIASRN
jgi:hypothetical protein